MFGPRLPTPPVKLGQLLNTPVLMHDNADTLPSYINNVTGSMESSEPPNFRGGLLADQMGLGKSLSIISLIASNPLVGPVDSDGIFSTPLVASKATLLIVPLPRKSSVYQQ
jgi:SNF2 family DNA or RNA helicase